MGDERQEIQFLTDLDLDRTYTFEGYDVLQYASESDRTGTIIATFDIPNGVTKVVDITDASANIPISEVTAFGTDNGVRHSMRIDGLDNYRDYYFGVRAYAYNPNSTPLVSRGPVSRITVRPARLDARNGGTRIAIGAFDAAFTKQNGRVAHEGKGTGRVAVNVVDPSVLTRDTYRVRFYEQNVSADPTRTSSPTTTFSVATAQRLSTVVLPSPRSVMRRLRRTTC